AVYHCVDPDHLAAHVGERSSREAGRQAQIRSDPARSPVVAPALDNVDDAERGHADEPAGMSDRDHELTHLQRRLPELSKHRWGRLELEGGEVALPVARDHPR